MTEPDNQIPPFPDWALPDNPADTTMADFRMIAEWHFNNTTTEADRPVVRRMAATYREELIKDGVDLDDETVVDVLWQGWYTCTRAWLNFMLQDCPGDAEHTAFHATRAMQWSGMTLLLATEDIPE